MPVKWYGDKVIKEVNAARSRALTKACLLVVRSIKQSFPDSGIKNATKKQREANRSKPGEIPHVQTGTLRASIDYEIVGDEGHVGPKLGPAAKYGKWLEIGTPGGQMKPRPYLRPGLAREANNIIKMFADIL